MAGLCRDCRLPPCRPRCLRPMVQFQATAPALEQAIDAGGSAFRESHWRRRARLLQRRSNRGDDRATRALGSGAPRSYRANFGHALQTRTRTTCSNRPRAGGSVRIGGQRAPGFRQSANHRATGADERTDAGVVTAIRSRTERPVGSSRRDRARNCRRNSAHPGKRPQAHYRGSQV